MGMRERYSQLIARSTVLCFGRHSCPHHLRSRLITDLSTSSVGSNLSITLHLQILILLIETGDPVAEICR